MEKDVLSVRKFKVGYEVREEISAPEFEAVVLNKGDDDEGLDALVSCINRSKGREIITKSAYTPDGHYIGNPKQADFLVRKRGIKPELSTPNHKLCSIGFCEREQKWYGWSHRAIFGFGVGDIVAEGDCTASSGYTEAYLDEHPEDDTSLRVGFTAKDLIDAKIMAMAFASSVG